MEIPAREFYRYLLLNGYEQHEIVAQFNQLLLLLPPLEDVYHAEQVSWARETIGTQATTVPAALRRVHMHDMWAAHKGRKTGEPCKSAYHLVSLQGTRKPLEALLVAGWQDWEIAEAINKSLTQYVEIRTPDIQAYRRYFFDSRILSAQDRQYLVLRHEHVRIGLLSLESDLLLFALGLRYNTSDDVATRSYERAWRTWLLHLESLPLRTDREGLKSTATFLSSIKSLDRPDKFKPTEDLPLVKLLRNQHETLEENLR